MIYVLRQTQEKCREQNMGLYVAFMEMMWESDTVSRDGLWKILWRLGCPPKFVTMICQLHEGQRGQVKQNGPLVDSFPISNGIKQGCVLAPSLFSIFFSMMLREAKDLFCFLQQCFTSHHPWKTTPHITDGATLNPANTSHTLEV